MELIIILLLIGVIGHMANAGQFPCRKNSRPGRCMANGAERPNYERRRQQEEHKLNHARSRR
jgi:hypothetical protein